MKPRQVDVKGVRFVFPKKDTVAFVSPEEEKFLYLRIKPPHENFELVYNEWERYRRNWQGGGYPLVSHINDVPSGRFEAINFPSGITVCRNDVPYVNCGLRVVYLGANWNVLFDRSEAPKSESIRRRAIEALQAYRG